MSHPKRILHLSTDSKTMGGAERLLLDMARLSDPERSKLHFAFIQPGDVIPAQLRERGAETSVLNLGSLLSLPIAEARLQRLLMRFRPHIVHTHLIHGGLLGYFSSAMHRWAGVKLVHTRHYDSFLANKGSPLTYAVDSWVTRRFDHVLAVSESVRKHLIEVEKVPPSKVTLTTNGVDTEHLSALNPGVGRERLFDAGIPRCEEALVVTCVANLFAHKGHEHLLRAWKEVHKELAAHLVLIGHGPEGDSLRTLAAQLGVEKFVHFLGQRSDATLLVAGSDLYVQPSLVEGFGLALAEAMAIGRANVAFAVGGLQRVVVDGVTGILVPPADTHGLAQAILMLGKDAEFRKRLGAAGARRARDEYSVQRMIDQIEAVYDQVLG